jgi:hypothetical protein
LSFKLNFSIFNTELHSDMDMKNGIWGAMLIFYLERTWLRFYKNNAPTFSVVANHTAYYTRLHELDSSHSPLYLHTLHGVLHIVGAQEIVNEWILKNKVIFKRVVNYFYSSLKVFLQGTGHIFYLHKHQLITIWLFVDC